MSWSRATSIDEAKVQIVYEYLASRRAKYKFARQDIYTSDETGCVTVHRPPEVTVPKGKRTVSQMTPAERGTLVTLVAIIGATGKSVPPFLVFPRLP